jgi:hypothetical protein
MPYINQLDAAIATVIAQVNGTTPLAGQNIIITPSPSGTRVALANNIVVNNITANGVESVSGMLTVGAALSVSGSITLLNPGIATSPANEFAAPSLVFTGSYWHNTPPGAHPDSYSLDVTMLGSSFDNQSSAVLTLNHVGANIAYFTLGPQIFRFTSGGENVLGTVSGVNFVVSPEHSDGTVFTLTAAANAIGNLTTYTGSNIAVVPPEPGQYVTIAGFTNGANNGRFLVSSSTVGGGGSVTVYNAGGIAETHAGTSTTDFAYPPQGVFSSVGFGSGVFHLLGTSHNTQATFTGEPGTIQLAIGMDGNATDAGYMRVINDPVSGNHGIELGAVIDGTGVAPVFMQLGHIAGQSTAAFNAPLTLLGSTSGSASIGVAAAAGTPNQINLPTTTGTAGQVLTTDGMNPQQLSWSSGSGPQTETVRVVYASNPLAAGALSSSIPVTFSSPFADANYTVSVSVETAAAMQSATVVATFQKQGTPQNGVNVQVLNNDSLSHTVTVHVIARHD